MSVLARLLWTLFGASFALGGPVQRGTWPEGFRVVSEVQRGTWPEASGGVDPVQRGTWPDASAGVDPVQRGTWPEASGGVDPVQRGTWPEASGGVDPVQRGTWPEASGGVDPVQRGTWPQESGGVDPVQRGTWPEGTKGYLVDEVEEASEDQHTSFYQLPVYQHAPGPLVPRDLFRPVPHKSPLPPGLNALLLPSNRQQSLPGPVGRAVQVLCGMDHIAVRVDRLQLRAWTVPSRFRLGSCQASRISTRYLYFHSRLTECDGEAKVVGGQLVYTFSLCYNPPPQGYVIRVPTLDLPIHCHYDRFHYSYQIGFRPQVQHTTFMKSIRSKLNFSLTVCNDQWEPLAGDHWLILGEPVYFVAEAGPLLAGEKLYVDSCYATSSEDADSMPKVEIITNYGCMTDSQRETSSSCFQSRESNVLKFLVDAFILRAHSQVLYLHCSMSVGLTTSYTSKACNYNKAAGWWEELEGSPSVCSCCNSVCGDMQDSTKNMVSSPGWHVRRKVEDEPKMRARSFQAEEGRESVNLAETNEQSIDEPHKILQTFPQETEVGQDNKKEEAVPEKSLTVVNQQGKKDMEGETEEVIMGRADSQLTKSKEDINIIRPEEYEMVQDREEISSTESEAVHSSFSHTSSDIDATITAINSSFGIFYNTSDYGSSENVSTAKSERGTSAGYGNMDPAISAEIIRATLDPSRFASVRDLSVNQSLIDSVLETLPRTRSVNRNHRSGSTGLPNVRKIDTWDTPLWSEQVESANKPVDTQSERITRHAGYSVDGKGPDGGSEILHSLQIRGFDSAYPPRFRDPVCVDGSNCDSRRVEGEVLHQSQFTEAANTKRKEFSPERVRSGYANSEQMHEDSPNHSAVATVTTTLQGSESNFWTDREWAEVVGGWSLHSLGFVVAKQMR